jgi:hypothetical protein
MATPKPGEIRCPTCHRSTPPAAFCTQCGSAIPSDARIRPRGMDRDELQDRIRARRSGADPYRRGVVPDEGTGSYQRFEPEPDDSRARRAAQAGERRDAFDEGAADTGDAAGAVPPAPDRPPDITRESDDWAERPSLVPPLPPPSFETPPPPVDEPAPVDHEPAAYIDNFDDAAYDDAAVYPYEYDEWEDGRQRRSSGAGAFAILGFLALGVLALLAGAVLAGVFSGDPNVGVTDPTLTPSPSLHESVPPSEAPSVAPSTDASAEPPASGEPVVFPDGFTAEAQPCIPGSVTTTGCDSNGASNSGQVEIWVGFQNGSEDDVVGAVLVGPDGNTIADGSVDLADIRCGANCNGYTYFPFSGLAPGTYEVRISRNGEAAGSTTFEVS